MKFKSFIAGAFATLAMSFAFADQGDVLVTFSTPGPDTYADGTTVKDGEWYALCWSANDSFGGFKTDGSALADGDEVILAAPLAEGGKCPFTAFEFARKGVKYDTGKFSVFLLDTRDSAGNPATAREQVFVKSGTVASSVAKGGADAATAQAVGAVGGASVAWTQPTELGAQQIAETKAAEITSFRIVGANVQMTVRGNAAADSCFVVRTGESVDRMNTYSITAPQSSGDGSTTFIVPREKGNFFSVGTLAK